MTSSTKTNLTAKAWRRTDVYTRDGQRILEIRIDHFACKQKPGRQQNTQQYSTRGLDQIHVSVPSLGIQRRNIFTSEKCALSIGANPIPACLIPHFYLRDCEGFSKRHPNSLRKNGGPPIDTGVHGSLLSLPQFIASLWREITPAYCLGIHGPLPRRTQPPGNG